VSLAEFVDDIALVTSPPFRLVYSAGLSRRRLRPNRRDPQTGGDAMRLTPTEVDRLTIFTAAELARRRRAKGW
jgi:hypothetical protein